MKLKNVTLFGVDCVDIERLINVAEICQQRIEFGAVKLLTSLPTDHPQTIKIDPINSIRDYSVFMLKKMDKYIETDFSIVIQYDGYILNPAAWNNEFFKYDYIGAPVVDGDRLIVGNGGFSFRSKKLTKILSEDDEVCVDDKYRAGSYYAKSMLRHCHENEDQIISQIMRQHLENRGVLFPPVDLAGQFSIEGNHLVGWKWTNQFGFHGAYTFP